MRVLLKTQWLTFCLLCAACGGGGAVPAPALPSDVPASGLAAVTVALSVSGVPLSPVLGSQTCSLLVLAPKTVHRRIEPGEIPDRLGLGQITPASGNIWRLAGLPAGKTLILQVALAPQIDLSTGAPVGAKSSYRARLHVPLSVPALGSTLNEIRIEFRPNPEGGYLADIRSTPADGSTGPLRTQLNYAARSVSRDNNADGDFAGETVLPDEALLGLSQPLLARLEAEYAGAGTPARAAYTAEVRACDPASGRLTLSRLQKLGEGGVVLEGPQTLHFAEDCAFSRRSVSVEKETLTALLPTQLTPGALLNFSAAQLQNADTAQPELWLASAQNLQLDLPPDSIAAVPDRQSARPGEPVPVTVYVNRTAGVLRRVSRLRISFNAGDSYLPGSLNPGDRGGGAAEADGVWAGLSGGFELPAADKVASGALDAARSYVDLSIAPAAQASLTSATGALCNFALICHNNATLGVEKASGDGLTTAYVGADGQAQTWSICSAASTPQVSVSGEPVLLSLLSPALVGQGSQDRPYIAGTGSSIRFALRDPLDGEVTDSPDTRFHVSGRYGLTIPCPGGRMSVLSGYSGMLRVNAEYRGVFSSPASDIYLFIDDAGSLRLSIDEAQTYLLGGSCQAWTVSADSSDGRYFYANIEARQPKGLRALFFELQFNPEIYKIWDVEQTALFGAEQGFVLADPSVPRTGSNDGTASWGMVAARPQESPGFTSGGGVILRVRFQRAPLGYDPKFEAWPRESEPYAPRCPSASVYLDAGSGEIRWDYRLPGDFNQDGEVNYLGRGPGIIGDFTSFAMHLGDQGFAPDSLAAVIDEEYSQPGWQLKFDGRIDALDLLKLGKYNRAMIDGWTLYYAASLESYPDSGSPQFSISQAQYSGDPETQRIFFRWQPPAPPKAGFYWVVPRLQDQSGWPSAAFELK